MCPYTYKMGNLPSISFQKLVASFGGKVEVLCVCEVALCCALKCIKKIVNKFEDFTTKFQILLS